MTTLTSRFAWLLGTAVPLALVYACSLDWNVHAGSAATRDGDGGGAPEAGPETSADAAIAPGEDAADDAPRADCVALKAEVARTFPNARSCTFGAPNQCKNTVTDSCSCPVVVADPNAPSTAAFTAAVAAFVAACGQTGCAACPPEQAKNLWLCLATSKCSP